LNGSSPSLLPSLSYFFTFPTSRCVTCGLTPHPAVLLPTSHSRSSRRGGNHGFPLSSVEFRLLERELGRSHRARGIGTARRRRGGGGVSWCKRSTARMRGEDETMDLHSHCCRCHAVSVRRTSSSHASGREEDVRALSQAKRKEIRRKGQKESANAFESRRLVFSHKPYLSVFFFRNFCLWPNWISSIGRCRKSGDHPYEVLAKSGYKPYMNYKSRIIHLYSWLYNNVN